MKRLKDEESIWSRSFTILIAGTFVSNAGYAVMSFASSMMLLEISNSAFMFSLYLVIYNATRIVAPIFIGPYLDTFSRRKMIYAMDYTVAAVYFVFLVILLFNDTLPVLILLVSAFVFGITSSIYTIAYDSIFPLLVSKDNFQKAYSLNVMLADISYVAYPIAALLYTVVGIRPLLLIGVIAYFIAATVEIFITVEESQIEPSTTTKQYFQTLKEGVEFELKNNVLLLTTAGFFIVNVMIGVDSALWLPYFNGAFENGYLYYVVVAAAETVGVFCGSFIIYKTNFGRKWKYVLSAGGFLVALFLKSLGLLLSLPIAVVALFIAGFSAIVADSIASAAINRVLDDDIRGRYSGITLMGINMGLVCGEFLSGVLGDAFPPQLVNLGIGLVSVAAFFIVIVLIGRKKVSKLYDEGLL